MFVQVEGRDPGCTPKELTEYIERALGVLSSVSSDAPMGGRIIGIEEVFATMIRFLRQREDEEAILTELITAVNSVTEGEKYRQFRGDDVFNITTAAMNLTRAIQKKQAITRGVRSEMNNQIHAILRPPLV